MKNQYYMHYQIEFTFRRESLLLTLKIYCSFTYRYLSWIFAAIFFLSIIIFNLLHLKSSLIPFQKFIYFYARVFCMEHPVSFVIFCRFLTITAYQRILFMNLVKTPLVQIVMKVSNIFLTVFTEKFQKHHTPDFCENKIRPYNYNGFLTYRRNGKCHGENVDRKCIEDSFTASKRAKEKKKRSGRSTILLIAYFIFFLFTKVSAANVVRNFR